MTTIDDVWAAIAASGCYVPEQGMCFASFTLRDGDVVLRDVVFYWTTTDWTTI